jgi:peptidyl-prolyl cis-trans isomerase C
MEIVAQVYDWEITKTELDYEEFNVRKHYPDADPEEIRTFAITQLVDRYLLMQEAIDHGFSATDEEFDAALMQLLDEPDASGISIIIDRFGRDKQLERAVTSPIIIQKYIDSLGPIITDEILIQFYEERKDFFCQSEMVRASQIMVKGTDEAAETEIHRIHGRLKSKEDFLHPETLPQQTGTAIYNGDLGFFPRGRLLPEIDLAAFSLQLNEISQPFATRQGWHILMLTEKKDKLTIPFEEIKDCLKASLFCIEEELNLAQILSNIRKRKPDPLQIFDEAFI